MRATSLRQEPKNSELKVTDPDCRSSSCGKPKARVISWVLKSAKGRRRTSASEQCHVQRTHLATAALKRKEGAVSQDMGVPLEAGKGKDMALPGGLQTATALPAP